MRIHSICLARSLFGVNFVALLALASACGATSGRTVASRAVAATKNAPAADSSEFSSPGNLNQLYLDLTVRNILIGDEMPSMGSIYLNHQLSGRKVIAQLADSADQQIFRDTLLEVERIYVSATLGGALRYLELPIGKIYLDVGMPLQSTGANSFRLDIQYLVQVTNSQSKYLFQGENDRVSDTSTLRNHGVPEGSLLIGGILGDVSSPQASDFTIAPFDLHIGTTSNVERFEASEVISHNLREHTTSTFLSLLDGDSDMDTCKSDYQEGTPIPVSCKGLCSSDTNPDPMGCCVEIIGDATQCAAACSRSDKCKDTCEQCREPEEGEEYNHGGMVDGFSCAEGYGRENEGGPCERVDNLSPESEDKALYACRAYDPADAAWNACIDQYCEYSDGFGGQSNPLCASLSPTPSPSESYSFEPTPEPSPTPSESYTPEATP